MRRRLRVRARKFDVLYCTRIYGQTSGGEGQLRWREGMALVKYGERAPAPSDRGARRARGCHGQGRRGTGARQFWMAGCVSHLSLGAGRSRRRKEGVRGPEPATLGAGARAADPAGGIFWGGVQGRVGGGMEGERKGMEGDGGGWRGEEEGQRKRSRPLGNKTRSAPSSLGPAARPSGSLRRCVPRGGGQARREPGRLLPP